MEGVWILGFVFVLLFVLPIGIAHNLGRQRNRNGWVYGFLLGWLGVLILSCTSYLPSAAEIQVRERDALRQLAE